jgi:hypothetical protein
MKFMFSVLLVAFASVAIAQPKNYFSLYDNKVYSLKTKGVRDFAVDVSSSQLTDLVNQQKIFGTVKDLVFKVYWTQNPERLAVDIVGLPEGFYEAKNELRASFMPLLDNLLPMTVEQRFPGYKIAPGTTPKQFVATDPSGLAPIKTYVLKFDDQDRLSEINGIKPLGTWNMNWVYEKKAFSDGRWVLSQITVTDSVGSEAVKTTRKLNYGSANGIGVLSEVVLTVETQGQKSLRTQENIEFRNYRINTGEGMRYFLSDTPAQPKKP